MDNINTMDMDNYIDMININTMDNDILLHNIWI